MKLCPHIIDARILEPWYSDGVTETERQRKNLRNRERTQENNKMHAEIS